jgi:hypothetical protein
MNRIKITTLLIIISVLVTFTVSAKPTYDLIVLGTGDPAIDVPAVQYAVEQGGKILLRGTFDFGDLGTVTVLNDDVEIHGEKIKNIYNTKIVGGHVPFLVGSSATGLFEWYGNPSAIVPVNNFTIQDIYFENPMIAVAVTSCHGEVRITGNKIVDGRPYDLGYPFNFGIYVGSGGALYDPTVLTADITVSGNFIDGKGRSWGDDPEDTWAVYDPIFKRWYRGIASGIIFSNSHMQAKFVDNEIVNTFGVAIYIDNDFALSEEMEVRIGRNTLIPSPNEMYGDPIDIYNSKVHITQNNIEVSNPESWGLACAPCYDSIVEGNDISYHGWLGAISLVSLPFGSANYWPVSGNLVRNNKLSGEAPFAIAVTPNLFGAVAEAENNAMLGNNISMFEPDPTVWGFGAHYFFDVGANYNLVIGNGGDVLDWGVGNVITGLTPVAGEVGPNLSEALAKKKEFLQLFK